MGRAFRSDLSVKGLRKLQKELRQYQRVEFKSKLQRFVSELADVGIRMAKLNRGEFKEYIGFVKEVRDTKYNYQSKALVIGLNQVPNVVTWLKDGGAHSVEINSLMMAEFGSGQFAVAGHRGTFPDQKHAFEDEWSYIPIVDGRLMEEETSSGVHATMPMFRAYIDMKNQIETIANRVFSR